LAALIHMICQVYMLDEIKVNKLNHLI